MTKRFSGFVVMLDADLREDEAEQTLNALRQIKGVIKVTPNVSTIGDDIAYERARLAVYTKVLELFKADRDER